MQLVTLLNHLSAEQKESALRELLAHEFTVVDGEISPDNPSLQNPYPFMQNKLRDLIEIAERNLKELRGVDVNDCDIVEELLEEDIHDACASIASDINNSGSDEQSRYLVVEHRWTAKEINERARNPDLTIT